MIEQHHPHRLRRVVGIAIAITFAAVTLAAFFPASAKRAAGAPAPVPNTDGAIMLVLDLSASMRQPITDDASGATRLAGAKQAVADVVAALPADAEIGLRVYGDLFDAVAPAAREVACATDTRLIAAPGELNGSALVASLDDLEARGDTPIGLAVQAAADDIPGDTEGTIVLVTDGRDECYDADLDGDPAVGPSFGPAPCEVAASIAERRAELEIHVIGFAESNISFDDLACFADETGGTSTTADDATTLTEEITELAMGVPRVVAMLDGLSIDGTIGPAGAPEVTGLIGGTQRYVDEVLVGENSVRIDDSTAVAAHYRVSVISGAPFTVTAAVIGVPLDATLDMTVFDADGEQPLFRAQTESAAATAATSARVVGWMSGFGLDRVEAVIRVAVIGDSTPESARVELTLHGPAVVGGNSNCPAGAACQFPDTIDTLERRTALLDDAIEARNAEPATVPNPLVVEVQELRIMLADAPVIDPDAMPSGRPVMPIALAAIAGLVLGGAIALQHHRSVSTTEVDQ